MSLSHKLKLFVGATKAPSGVPLGGLAVQRTAAGRRPALLGFAICLLAALSLGQVSSELVTEDIRRVGSKLACLCGSCKNSVGDCAMLACHYSKPAREKIKAMQAEGKSDQEIVDAFVKEEGIRALVTPPAEGFNLLAWVMPFVMIGVGLAGIWWFIRRFSRPAAAPEVDPRVMERYQDAIEKDLSKLDG
jgi:cytochrome c-type biogenesis protein CcmH